MGEFIVKGYIRISLHDQPYGVEKKAEKIDDKMKFINRVQAKDTIPDYGK